MTLTPEQKQTGNITSTEPQVEPQSQNPDLEQPIDLNMESIAKPVQSTSNVKIIIPLGVNKYRPC